MDNAHCAAVHSFKRLSNPTKASPGNLFVTALKDLRCFNASLMVSWRIIHIIIFFSERNFFLWKTTKMLLPHLNARKTLLWWSGCGKGMCSNNIITINNWRFSAQRHPLIKLIWINKIVNTDCQKIYNIGLYSLIDKINR